MTDLSEHFDEHLKELMDKATDIDLESNEATTAMKNLKLFSECRPPKRESAPTSPVPETRTSKVLARTARILDNETTRTFIKAGGAFAGVAIVAWTTVHKDHVLERQALAQANQRPS